MSSPVRQGVGGRASQAVERLIAAPIDPASLAAFRILFGLVMAGGAVRFMALGWVDEFYVRPSFHFTWALFPWVRPLPEPLMHLHFAALALLAVGIAVGFHYRLCAALFCLGFTYVELIDKTTYLNHYYLVSLLSGLLVFLPAQVEWSVDRWRRPSLATRTIPAWTITVLRFQLAVVYVFAGAAKLNADWLFDAQPLRLWLAARSDLPVIGPLLSQLWVAYAFSWFGAAYDLTIVLFLLRQRTRVVAYLTVVVFHVMTWILFPIGTFPWIMTVSTLVFFSPDWPRRFIRASPAARRSSAAAPVAPGRAVRAALVAHVVIQLLVPLRAYWPGADPNWTGRGFNFAWRVMLVEKSGVTQLVARDPSTGREWPVPIRDYITERQERMMAQDPFMVRVLARHVADDLRSNRDLGVMEIHADSFASLNGRPAQRLIDPTIDLAGPMPADWIVPLQTSRGDLTESDAASPVARPGITRM